VKASFADVLAPVYAKLGPAFLADGGEEQLRGMASPLAAVLRGGFEVRLGPGPRRVDLHQCVLARDGEPGVLLAHLRQAGPVDPAMEALFGLGEGWTEVWLEYDATAAGVPRRPSLFIGVDGAEAARAVLQCLLPDGEWAARWPSVRRGFDACRGPARVSHLGLLSGRPSSPLRLNVASLTADQVVPYLRDVGWTGRAENLSGVVAWLADQVERVKVCVDVPPAGVEFECSWSEQPDAEPGWGALLADLVDRGACGSDQRDAFLAWPQTVTPVNSPEPWPVPFIVSELKAPGDRFGAVHCRVSHVKVSSAPGQELRAKGYLAFAHTWLEP
jgi:hypothetical protein